MNKTFGLLVLFVFIVGFIGDLIIHKALFIKFPYRKPWFAQGLVPYYKSMEYGNSKILKTFNSWVLSGIAGGLACVFSVVIGYLLLQLVDNLEPM